MRPILAAALACLVLPAQAETTRHDGYSLTEATYACERGITVPASYLNFASGLSLAIIHVDGRQVVLEIARSGSGARYLSVSGGRYEWWTKGDDAMLSWRAADGAEEQRLLADCRAANATP